MTDSLPELLSMKRKSAKKLKEEKLKFLCLAYTGTAPRFG
ncbi:hypothetical protein COLO4_35804 [Corchorus olitorius]|uniref:Uncharacterized protein n=1 Tax=Corchorus olitorius TaxID=93759 RepID=A0A1R3GD92_9ROSI|nr:hypothetical protein COLO4_35804 [Corchorus olitorius]